MPKQKKTEAEQGKPVRLMLTDEDRRDLRVLAARADTGMAVFARRIVEGFLAEERKRRADQ